MPEGRYCSIWADDVVFVVKMFIERQAAASPGSFWSLKDDDEPPRAGPIARYAFIYIRFSSLPHCCFRASCRGLRHFSPAAAAKYGHTEPSAIADIDDDFAATFS